MTGSDDQSYGVFSLPSINDIVEGSKEGSLEGRHPDTFA